MGPVFGVDGANGDLLLYADDEDINDYIDDRESLLQVPYLDDRSVAPADCTYDVVRLKDGFGIEEPLQFLEDDDQDESQPFI